MIVGDLRKQQIAAARPADIPRLVEMGLRFLSTSSYRDRLARNPDALGGLMERLIDSDDGYLAVQLTAGHVTGMIGAWAYLHPWAGELIAGELFWWVEPEARGFGKALMRSAEQWAARKGCVRFQMVAPSDRVGERVGRLYRAAGYQKLEEVWQRAV